MPKEYKITKKEIAESKIWIDGFQNALKSAEKVGFFPKWKPIDTAPKEDMLILVFVPFNFIGKPEIMQLHTSHIDELKCATHWMPLPEFPIK